MSESKCQRSKVNGSLLIVMPKVLSTSALHGHLSTYSFLPVMCVVSGESERIRGHNQREWRCEGEKERYEEQAPASSILLLFKM